MKETNPLLPQGSFEAQANKKSHVRIAVFTILAIHVVVLGALLIQGCKRDTEEAVLPPPAPTNDIPPLVDAVPVITPGPTSAIPSALVQTTAVVAPPPLVIPPPIVIPPPPFPITVADAVAAEHVITRGDTFDSLSKKHGVSVKAIQAANPALNPTRLKIGDKVKIPARTAAAPAAAPTSLSSADPALHVVVSGDNLGAIAKKYHTTVKEIQRLNNMTTTQIKVGQKLKLPASASASAVAPPPAPVPAPASLPGGVPLLAPAQ